MFPLITEQVVAKIRKQKVKKDKNDTVKEVKL